MRDRAAVRELVQEGVPMVEIAVSPPVERLEPERPVAGVSFVDWSAVIAGGVLAAAIAFVLLTFGTAIGLSLTSPAAVILMLGGLLVLSSAGVTTVEATATSAVHVANQ